VKIHKHLKKKTSIFFGNVWNAEIPLNLLAHRTYVPAANKTVPLKMSAVTHPTAADQDILIHDSDKKPEKASSGKTISAFSDSQ
jgi:hypothetical protein